MNRGGESEAEIRRAAADWVVRRDAGLSPDEQDRFLQWLAADERHREWLARQSGSWAALDGLGDLRPIPHVESSPQLPVRPMARRWPASVLFGLAMAAAVAMIIFVLGGPPSPTRAQPLLERRVLEDGSVAELKEGAEVEVHYSAAQRRLTLLRGEARFIVQKDAARPFLVDAGGVAVRAVGTAFNVSLLRQTVEVVVTEGQIKLLEIAARGSEAHVSAAETVAPLLVAGQRARLSLAAPGAAPEITEVGAAELQRLQAWQPVLLDFSAVPLRRVIEEFNRLNRRQLVLLDAGLGELPIVASFRSDNLDGFVELLARTAGIAVERRDDHEIALRRARP
jgi:transmembrane sensor